MARSQIDLRQMALISFCRDLTRPGDTSDRAAGHIARANWFWGCWTQAKRAAKERMSSKSSIVPASDTACPLARITQSSHELARTYVTGTARLPR